MGKKGNIDICPNCSSKMEKKLTPFKYHGTYIGRYDAYVCNLCHRIYFTEGAYNEIMDLPLNPDETREFSDETVTLGPKTLSVFIILVKKKPLTNAQRQEGALMEAITESVGYKGSIAELEMQEVS